MIVPTLVPHYPIKSLLTISLSALALLLCAVWLYTPEFTACEKDSIWCSIAYWSTESAGKFGTLLIIFITSILYTVNVNTWGGKTKTFAKSIVALSIFLGGFAFLNEHGLKHVAKFRRPSHSYIITLTASGAGLDSLYLLTENARQDYFSRLLKNDTTHFKTIDQRVLDHWVEEAGYSFPSGHSFNAFVLASIMAFSLFHVRNRFVRRFYFLPFIWATLVAISRVAIGAHTALDVSIGALLGILVSHAFIYFDRTRRIIIHKKHIS